jgi:formate hydrogenlyase transcriptional activator
LAAKDHLSELQALLDGTARATGSEFFPALVRQLAITLRFRHALVTELIDPQKVRTLAYWSRDQLLENMEYALAGTPCEEVMRGQLCQYESGLQLRYPVTEPGLESYLGFPLRDNAGVVIGHLCVLDEASAKANTQQLMLIELFAARAAAELGRLRAERMHQESEERFRDLFDEAPIAYVHEGLDSKFIRANRAALRILGVRPDQAKGFMGASLAPDTPDAQRRLREAFESVGKGTDTSGVVLELRRKDNDKPIFIQWWSKPDSGGTFTRTMFIDITARVLMEREQIKLQAQNLYLKEELKAVHNFEEIIGASGGLMKVLANVKRVAPTDASVLIWGETGTGKELIARAIHSSSQRAEKAFIKLNCAAMPAGLVESELFGHERGAFSGAVQRRIGRFELANGGTIFLDEIGEMPLDVQAKLLRVLQEHEFERVGSSATTKVDVRVVAASNRDLRKAVRDGEFREDLYYRLNVFPIDLPPLRDRVADIPLLVGYFVKKHAPRVGRRVESVEPETLARLAIYPWPGNIRELENLVERALILNNSSALCIDTDILGPLPPQIRVTRQDSRTVTTPTDDDVTAANDEGLNAVQRDHIVRTLRATRWIIEGDRGAAVRLGMKPATLRHRMKKLGIARNTELPV